MITVDGDSMEPLLSSGDRVLIDVSRPVPVPPGIFVIWDGMGLVAKHIEHVPHSGPPKVRATRSWRIYPNALVTETTDGIGIIRGLSSALR